MLKQLAEAVGNIPGGLIAVQAALERAGMSGVAHVLQDLQHKVFATSSQIDEATEIYCNDVINIDDDALLSISDEGHWVQAWVWVGTGE